MSEVQGLKYYLDTYAMREYLRGNRSYQKYFSGHELITSLMNLIELYYLVLRDDGESAADKSYLAFKQYEVSITDHDIRNAMKFRLGSKARKEDVSYADAIGYIIAKRYGVTYLTGDDAFEGFPNVLFIK